MTAEHAALVGVPPTTELDGLLTEIQSAIARSRKAEPGDRTDITRFEALASQLEQLAIRQAQDQAPLALFDGPALLFGMHPDAWDPSLPPEVRSAALSMVEKGLLPVIVSSVLERGAIQHSITSATPPRPTDVWKSSGVRGRKAVEERFRAQIIEALHADDLGNAGAISPSGVQNRVVTEILREFVASTHESGPTSVPVEYRDGSKSAHPFMLRSLPLLEAFAEADLEIRFALLSIRHTEMDHSVDGAWLRNTEISRPRPAGQTDDLVYEISRTQFDVLTQGDRSVRIHLYQTGLEPAVVGFYKALTDHLLHRPGSVALQPMYFASSSRRSEKPRTTVTQKSSPFQKGTPWAM